MFRRPRGEASFGCPAIIAAAEVTGATAIHPGYGFLSEDAEFAEDMPASFELPNVLTAAAVDRAGDETGFTSFGPSVDVHANGFEVVSYIPGGETMPLSGTSMSAPNVVESGSLNRVQLSPPSETCPTPCVSSTSLQPRMI